jgi:hypothetical protein
VGRKALGVVLLLVAVGVAVTIATASLGGGKTPKPYSPPAASKRFGDDADLMRRLERKKLVSPAKPKQHR